MEHAPYKHFGAPTTMYEMGMTYWLEKAASGVTTSRLSLVIPSVDLEDFIHDHRSHGSLTADVTTPALERLSSDGGMLLGVVFERWIAQVDAGLDLLRAARLN